MPLGRRDEASLSLRSGASSSTPSYGTAAPLEPAASSPERRLNPVLVALFSSLGGFLFGVDIGYISGVEVMDSFREDLNGGQPISDTTMGLITGIFALGAVAAASPPAAEAIMRAMSRRTAIVAGASGFCIGAALQGSAAPASAGGASGGVPIVLVGRFVSGAAVGVLTSHVPVYMSELAAAAERGRLVALYQLAITMGIMAAFWLNFALQDVPHGWRISVLAQIFPGVCLAVGMLRMPHSPRGLVARGHRAEALAVLRALRPKGADVEAELKDMEASYAEEMATGEATWAEFCSGPVAKISLVGVASQLLAQLSGMNVFMFYGPRVCETVGLSGFLFTAIAGVVNFVATFPAILLVDRYGRTRLLQYSAVGMCVACVGLALAGNLAIVCTPSPLPGEPEECKIQSPVAKYVAAASVYFFIANFAYGWGPVPWVLCSEIFPMKYRAKGVGLTTTASWLGTFVIGFFPPLLISAIGFSTFWIFAAFNLLALGFALWLPETRGKTLEQVSALFYRRFEGERGGPDAKKASTPPD